ncbi:ADP-ribosylation factor-like protein 13B [Leptotrombidium deliense]|uniref:ADP-ribosylation factor-like protein 13B n=1 Tax=Leptotrombidium deliense TaxID=299467 RepID=A0A443SFL5_9ACAR|nr:ADP-ribosylation factor-like protein 13B [Leptotrombidium deliense]
MGASISTCDTIKSVNVIPSICARRETSTINLLIIGLDNAGKTTTVKNLLGESLNDVVPTIGFSTVNMKKYKSFRVELYDLGGSRSIREIWRNYYALVHGFIYVIDSTDVSRIDEIKQNFAKVLSNEKVSGKPILVLINKQDVIDSIDEVELCSQLDLESVVNEYKCPTKIESCSAVYAGFKLKKDENISKAYKWLLEYIESNWVQLGERVRKETETQLKLEKLRIELRAKKFRRKSEEIETISETSVPYRNGNPFKPINKIVPLIRNEIFDENNYTTHQSNGLHAMNGFIKPHEINDIINNVTVVEVHASSARSNSSDCLINEEEKSNLPHSNGFLHPTRKTQFTSTNKRSNTAFKNKITPSIDLSILRRLSH